MERHNDRRADPRRGLLIGVAIGEALTGLALLAAPSAVGRLLLGQPLTGVAVPVAGVAGIALLGLAIACWPGPPRAGMAAYGALVALYLAYCGLTGAADGPLLWPAVLLHAVLTAALIAEGRRAIRRAENSGGS